MFFFIENDFDLNIEDLLDGLSRLSEKKKNFGFNKLTSPITINNQTKDKFIFERNNLVFHSRIANRVLASIETEAE